MLDATDVTGCMCAPWCLLRWQMFVYVSYFTRMYFPFAYVVHRVHTHARTHRSNVEHNMAIATRAFELRFVRYLKQTLSPPLNSGGQERLANKSQKPLIGV